MGSDPPSRDAVNSVELVRIAVVADVVVVSGTCIFLADEDAAKAAPRFQKEDGVLRTRSSIMLVVTVMLLSIDRSFQTQHTHTPVSRDAKKDYE